jgi:Fe-S cluster biosynthesis and repair protein YggX
MNKIFCTKLNREGTALSFPPYPGELGAKIQANICQEAWQEWLKHQTLLINEHRLSMVDAKARQFLAQEMESFLFGVGSAKPDGYKELNSPE